MKIYRDSTYICEYINISNAKNYDLFSDHMQIYDMWIFFVTNYLKKDHLKQFVIPIGTIDKIICIIIEKKGHQYKDILYNMSHLIKDRMSVDDKYELNKLLIKIYEIIDNKSGHMYESLITKTNNVHFFMPTIHSSELANVMFKHSYSPEAYFRVRIVIEKISKKSLSITDHFLLFTWLIEYTSINRAILLNLLYFTPNYVAPDIIGLLRTI